MSPEVVHEATPIDMVVPTITGSAALVIDDHIADPDIKGVKEAMEDHAFDSKSTRVKSNTARPGTILDATTVTNSDIMRATVGPGVKDDNPTNPTSQKSKLSKYCICLIIN